MGAILVFGLVIALLVIVQALAVPAANTQVEYEHSQRVRGDVVDFDRSVQRTAAVGGTGSSTVEAGVRYPTRFFLLNPGPAAGTVRTAERGFGIEHAVAVSPETGDYWDGRGRAYASRSLEYRADYNYYDGAARTTYEHGTVVDRFGDATLIAGGGGVVDGRRISLIALDGNRSTGSVDPVNVQIEPRSAPARTVSVTNAPGEAVTLRLASSLPNATWQELLADEPYVTGVSCEAADPCGNVTVTLQQGVTYDLRMAKVGIASGALEEPAHYLTAVSGEDAAVPRGGAQELVVQARDRFNNPVSGVPVTFATANGTFEDEDAPGERTVVTGEAGTASVLFRPVGSGSVTVTAAAGDLGDEGTVPDEPHEVVVFDGIRVGDGDEGDINPNQAGKVQLVRTSAVGGGGNDTVTLTFRSRTGESVDISGGRINFHSAGGPGASGGDAPTEAVVAGRSPPLEVAGEFETFDSPITIATSETAVVLAWDRNIRADHFYVLSLEFSNGDVERYFVAHRQ